MAKAKTAKKTTKKKAQQLRIAGTERLNRIKEVDEAAEAYRIARNVRQADQKIELAKKTLLKEVVKKHGLKDSYFYDDEDGDTEEVKPTSEVVEDVKVNKVKKPKAEADETED